MTEPGKSLNRILQRQLKRLTNQDGVNYEELLRVIEKTYDEFQETQKRADRTNSILVDEVMSLNEKINHEMQNVKDLLNTIEQGIFTFDKDLKIGTSFSTKAKIYFNLRTSQENDLASALNLNPAQIKSYESWIKNLFKPKALKRWHKYVALAPLKEISIEVNEEILVLSLDYKPVTKDEQLDRVMVLSTDVTRARAISDELERQKNIQNRHVEHVEAFFSNDHNSLHLFMKDLNDLEDSVAELSQMLLSETTNPDITLQNLKNFFSDVHTIKSSSGSQGFHYLASVCHKLEDLLDLAISMPGKLSLTPVIFKPLSEEAGQIRKFWDQLCHYSDSEATIAVRRDSYQKLCKDLSSVSLTTPPEIKEAVLTLHYLSVRSFSQKYNKIIKNLSQKNNLWIDDLVVQIENDCISPELAATIDPILLHLIRNSVDHGMESKEQRLANQKGPGTIRLEVKKQGSDYSLYLDDNGSGICPDHVFTAALKNNLVKEEQRLTMTDQDKLDLIFLPNFSTKDSVSSVSGRGVGMYAVKAMVLNHGGTIKVSSKPGQGTGFIITIPENSLKNIQGK